MTDTQPTGRYETRSWSSQFDARRDGEMLVFIPAPLHRPFRPGDVKALMEQRLADVNADPGLARVGPILTRSDGISSSRIEGLVMSTRRIYEASQRPEGVDDHPARPLTQTS